MSVGLTYLLLDMSGLSHAVAYLCKHAAPAQALLLRVHADGGAEPRVQGLPADASISYYTCRSYVHLTDFDIHEEHDLLRWKLETAKGGGCSGLPLLVAQ